MHLSEAQSLMDIGTPREHFCTGVENVLLMGNRTFVRGHLRNTGRGVVRVPPYTRRRRSDRSEHGHFYFEPLPRNRPRELVRGGYRNRYVDLGGSLTPNGLSVHGSVSLDKNTRMGVEHNPITSKTKPYIEEKGKPLDHREILKRLDDR